MADDVVLHFGADARDVDRAASTIRRAYDQARQGVERFGDAARRATRSVRDLDTEVKRIESVGRLLGGAFGEASGRVGDFADVVASGLSPVTAIAAGLAAAGLAAVAFAGHILDSTRNIDSLVDSLTAADRRALAPYIERTREANEALQSMDSSLAALSVTMAGTFASTIVDVADTIRGITLEIRRLNEALDHRLPGASVGELLFTLAAPNLAVLTNMFGRLGAAAREADASMSAQAAMLEALGFGPAPAEPAPTPPSARPAAPDPFDAFTGLTGRVTRTSDYSSGAEATAAADLAIWKLTQDRKTELLRKAEEERARIEREAEERRQQLLQAHLDAVRAAQEEETRIRAAAAGAAMSIAQGLGNFLVSQMQAEVAAGDMTREQQVEQQKRAATAQALVAGALAIVQGFAQLGPVAGAVAAVGTAAVTALQVAAIQRQTYHVGGTFAPDERLMSAVVRNNEVGAVFTRQAVDALGGPQAVEDLARTGRGDAAPLTINLYLPDGTQYRAPEMPRPRAMGQRDVRF